MCNARITGLSALLLLAAAGPIHAQSLDERIAAMRQKRQMQEQPAAVEVVSVDQKLATPMAVNYTGLGFREALERWSRQAGVRLLVNWPAFERDGVDATFPVTVELSGLPAAQVLLILMELGSDEFRFIAEIEPWGVELRTRDQANRDVEVRLYDVADLVMELPSFEDAPQFDLGEALQGGSGGGGGSGADLFQDIDANPSEEPTTRRQRGEALAETIRQTVEPDVWRENGGQWSSLTYRDGKLIVRAPAYVQAQLSSAAVTPEPTGFAVRSRDTGPRTGARQDEAEARPAGHADNDVAGVAEPAGGVAGVAE